MKKYLNLNPKKNNMSLSVTIFTIPKAFQGHIKTIQRNAIQSWKRLKPECEIILFGDDEGTAETAKELNLKHIPEIAKNEFGTPLINDIFEKAQKTAENKIVAYVNADIILMEDFMEAVQQIEFEKFLIVGRRWDLDVKDEINFNKDDWQKGLQERIKNEGKLHGPAGIDYFVFPKGVFGEIPCFAIGRTTWDNWLLYRAWTLRVPLINTTEAVVIVHQKHQYAHSKHIHFKKSGRVSKGKEAQKNLKLAKGDAHMLTIRDAEWRLTPTGLRRPKINFYRILSFSFRYFERLPILKFILFPGWLAMILWRKLQRFLRKLF